MESGADLYLLHLRETKGGGGVGDDACVSLDAYRVYSCIFCVFCMHLWIIQNIQLFCAFWLRTSTGREVCKLARWLGPSGAHFWDLGCGAERRELTHLRAWTLPRPHHSSEPTPGAARPAQA